VPDDYDVVVGGAGKGRGMTAAAVAGTRGLRAIVIEKTELVGGTNAISGGMVWASNTSKQSLVGALDIPERAAAYLEASRRRIRIRQGRYSERSFRMDALRCDHCGKSDETKVRRGRLEVAERRGARDR
jgi:flavin-dependent dehydrogenase